MDHLDAGHLGLFLSRVYERSVFESLDRRGERGIRTAHGYVIQRLIDGPRSVTAIARDLGVTQQAISKQLDEMEALGLVRAAPVGEDKRQRRVQLTGKATALIARTRVVRARTTARLVTAMGAKKVRELEKLLSDALGALGALDEVQQRKVKLPSP